MVRIRLHRREFDAWKKRAKHAELTLSEWVRTMIAMTAVK
jgi:hypothetical protein